MAYTYDYCVTVGRQMTPKMKDTDGHGMVSSSFPRRAFVVIVFVAPNHRHKVRKGADSECDETSPNKDDGDATAWPTGSQRRRCGRLRRNGHSLQQCSNFPS